MAARHLGPSRPLLGLAAALLGWPSLGMGWRPGMGLGRSRLGRRLGLAQTRMGVAPLVASPDLLNFAHQCRDEMRAGFR